jgi:2-alkyl-3-oxoalkanoate reductase
MKKALVTGGSGFLGRAIVRRLAAKGIEPVVVDRKFGRELDGPDIRFQGDIRDEKFLIEASRGCDIVFHTAAKKGGWGVEEEFHAVNVEGTRNVINACLANQVPNLVHTSTAKVVFTGNEVCGVNEKTPCATKFLSHYAHTKMLAEKLVLEANSEQLQTTVLRPGLLWGVGDTAFVPWLVKQGSQGGLKIIGDGRNLVDICHVENAAAAHLAAAASLETSGRAAGEAYFITQGEPVIFWKWINKFLSQLELPVVEESVSFQKAYRTGFILEGVHKLLGLPEEPRMTRYLAQSLARSQWYSIDKAERDLGYEPLISTAEGLRRTVEWVRSGD